MKKMKININRKPISSQEIGNMQDFGSVIKGAEVVALPFYKKWWFMGGVGTVIIVSIIISALTFNNSKPNAKQVAEQPTPANPILETPQNITETSTNSSNAGFTSIWVNSGEAKTHALSNETELSIAPYNFIDANGNKVEGTVEIRYREVATTKGTLIDDAIPVTYSSESENNQLAYAGIYEVKCFKDGQQVFTQPKYPISIQQKTQNVYVASNTTSTNRISDDVLLENSSQLTPAKTNLIVNKEVVQIDNASETTTNSKNENKEEFSNGLEVANDELSATIEVESGKTGIIAKKPSFNISYPIDPNDSLNIALENIVEEIKQLETQVFKKPFKMEDAKQNFTLKFDSSEHPELSVFNETIFGVANETHFTPALYKYKWKVAQLSKKSTHTEGTDSIIYGDSYVLQLSNATYIGEELFYKDVKIAIEHKPWYKRLWSDIKSLFSRERATTTSKKDNINPDENVKRSFTSHTDKTIRIIPIDSSQYYYQRSDYRSPVSFEIFPVLSDEQYAKAMDEYKKETKQHKKLLAEKKQQEKDIRDAIKKRRQKLINTHRKKIEIYMGLTKNTGLQ